MKQLLRLLVFISFFCLSLGLAQVSLPTGASQAAPPTYQDVPSSHWAFNALESMTNLGIFTGYPDGLFRGNEKLSRYEAAVVSARLIDYVDALLLVLAQDPDIAQKLKEATQELGPVSNLQERIAVLEAQMQEAASLEYTRALEARIIVLEQTLNDVLGTELPAAPLAETNPDLPQTAADAVSPETISSPGTSETNSDAQTSNADDYSLIATPLPDISLKAGASYPFYLGFSPGIITSSGDVYFATQFGYDGLIGPAGLSARLVFNSGLRELRASSDVTVRLQAFTDVFELYGGLGLGVSVQPVGDALLLEVPFGFEYFITPQIGLFGQVTTAYGFAPINNVDAQITMGVNLRF
ncbi:MAG: S-layer homology domain-containing protein [Trueperaceae bacterium]|nr:S-layer homology domain-containing protein [Trueperaceae bacterium]